MTSGMETGKNVIDENDDIVRRNLILVSGLRRWYIKNLQYNTMLQ